ncbi:MAG TPA: hypothetical protein VE422_17175 [Terriglobia bacterium]|nr:hypothetical protein [Terriglobia bacterium]
MKKLFRRLMVIAAIPLGLVTFHQYRVHSTLAAAARYAPRPGRPRVVPAGTPIEAVLKDRITETTRPGDTVVAFVSTPVMVEDKLAIPSRTQLNGLLERVSKNDEGATITLAFTSVVLNDRELKIETKPVTVAAPVESDIDFAEGALGTIGGAAIGVSIGAAMQSPQAIAMGLVDGILMAMPPPDDRIRFTTVLTHALHLW